MSKSPVARAGEGPLVDEDGAVLAGVVVPGEEDVVLVVGGEHQEGEVAPVAVLVAALVAAVEGVHQEDVAEEAVALVAAADTNEWIRTCGCCTSLFAISFRSGLPRHAVDAFIMVVSLHKDRATNYNGAYSGDFTTSMI